MPGCRMTGNSSGRDRTVSFVIIIACTKIEPQHSVIRANFTYKGNSMEEGKRQKQIAAVLSEEINDIFRRLSLNMINGGMLSISSIKVTPDLLEARIYLSMYKVENQKAALKKVESHSWEIKRELANRVKHQLRRIPVLKFYIDDTLDHVFRMEELFKQINEQQQTPPSPKGE